MTTRLLVLAAALAAAIPATAHAAPPTDAELEACLGTADTGLPALAKLKRKMTPADAAAAWPGADKVDKFGFATVKAQGCVGAKSFKLYYQTDRKTGDKWLYSAQIEFDAKLTKDADFYQRLVKLLEGKFGPVKDPKDVEKKLITWGAKNGIAQLTTSVTSPKAIRLSAPLVE